MTEFKVGDLVECIEDHAKLVLGGHYTVTERDGWFVVLRGIVGSWCPTRFELVESAEAPVDYLERAKEFVEAEIEERDGDGDAWTAGYVSALNRMLTEVFGTGFSVSRRPVVDFFQEMPGTF